MTALATPSSSSHSDAGTVVPYGPESAELWNAFVDRAKNGTFLHRRDFLEYHGTRFVDASVMYVDRGGLQAVTAFSRDGDHVTSHGGLTFGGVVCGPSMTAIKMLQYFHALRIHLLADGVSRVTYKTIPSIYHQQPADEDLYALFRVGAKLVRRDLLTVVEHASSPKLSSGRRDGIRKAVRAHLQVRASRDFGRFWKLLEQRLRDRHSAIPVHSLLEIQTLAKRFPHSIELHAAYDGETMLGGAVLFLSKQVAHVQYIASSAEGRRLGALDLLFEVLLRNFSSRRFFDFGASTELGGHWLNEGLVFQKEGFGGRSIAHDFYEWNLNERADNE